MKKLNKNITDFINSQQDLDPEFNDIMNEMFLELVTTEKKRKKELNK